jgi:hypothetical protein
VDEKESQVVVLVDGQVVGILRGRPQTYGHAERVIPPGEIQVDRLAVGSMLQEKAASFGDRKLEVVRLLEVQLEPVRDAGYGQPGDADVLRLAGYTKLNSNDASPAL